MSCAGRHETVPDAAVAAVIRGLVGLARRTRQGAGGGDPVGERDTVDEVVVERRGGAVMFEVEDEWPRDGAVDADLVGRAGGGGEGAGRIGRCSLDADAAADPAAVEGTAAVDRDEVVGRALDRQVDGPAVGGRVGKPDVLVGRDREPVVSRPVFTFVAGIGG